MFRLMLIAGAGGFLGTCLRFLVNKLFAPYWIASFPIATFIVNILGCLAFGIFSGYFEKSNMLSSVQATLLVTGFCGGFTTFSTFAGEVCSLGNRGEWGVSAAYLALSVIIGIAMVWLGRFLMR